MPPGLLHTRPACVVRALCQDPANQSIFHFLFNFQSIFQRKNPRKIDQNEVRTTTCFPFSSFLNSRKTCGRPNLQKLDFTKSFLLNHRNIIANYSSHVYFIYSTIVLIFLLKLADIANIVTIECLFGINFNQNFIYFLHKNVQNVRANHSHVACFLFVSKYRNSLFFSGYPFL